MSLCPNLGTERFETNWKFAIVFSEGALRCKVSPKCKKLQPLILASFLLSSALRALDRRNLLCAKFLAKQSIHYAVLHSSVADIGRVLLVAGLACRGVVG